MKKTIKLLTCLGIVFCAGAVSALSFGLSGKNIESRAMDVVPTNAYNSVEFDHLSKENWTAGEKLTTKDVYVKIGVIEMGMLPDDEPLYVYDGTAYDLRDWEYKCMFGEVFSFSETVPSKASSYIDSDEEIQTEIEILEGLHTYNLYHYSSSGIISGECANSPWNSYTLEITINGASNSSLTAEDVAEEFNNGMSEACDINGVNSSKTKIQNVWEKASDDYDSLSPEEKAKFNVSSGTSSVLPETVTDLTGLFWYPNQELNFLYGIGFEYLNALVGGSRDLFDLELTDKSGLVYSSTILSNLDVPYPGTTDPDALANEIVDIIIMQDYDREIDVYLYWKTEAGNNIFVYDNKQGGWQIDYEEGFQVTGGDDVDNQTLINWLLENGTLRVSPINVMLSSYDYIYAKYGTELELDNFLSRAVTPLNAKNNIINEAVTSTSWIVVAISLIGMTTIGAFFLYRKRKEN